MATSTPCSHVSGPSRGTALNAGIASNRNAQSVKPPLRPCDRRFRGLAWGPWWLCPGEIMLCDVNKGSMPELFRHSLRRKALLVQVRKQVCAVDTESEAETESEAPEGDAYVGFGAYLEDEENGDPSAGFVMEADDDASFAMEAEEDIGTDVDSDMKANGDGDANVGAGLAADNKDLDEMDWEGDEEPNAPAGRALGAVEQSHAKPAAHRNIHNWRNSVATAQKTSLAASDHGPHCETILARADSHLGAEEAFGDEMRSPKRRRMGGGRRGG